MKTSYFIREQQQEEIKTIKERNISISLSDADVERLCKKVGEAGLSVSELFKNFVGDLVDGTYSNGSDERMFANQWFDRCWFSMGFGERSFLQWLITNDAASEAINAWNDLQDAKNELQEFQVEDESDEEYADNCKEDISYFEEILNDMFNEYKSENKSNSSNTLENEMEKVMQWHEEMIKLKGSEKQQPLNDLHSVVVYQSPDGKHCALQRQDNYGIPDKTTGEVGKRYALPEGFSNKLDFNGDSNLQYDDYPSQEVFIDNDKNGVPSIHLVYKDSGGSYQDTIPLQEYEEAERPQPGLPEQAKQDDITIMKNNDSLTNKLTSARQAANLQNQGTHKTSPEISI